MRKNNKAALGLRTATILRDDAGASLVLVTIIAIIIITGVVILKITTSTLWASADKQYYQDRCYVMATSMGDSIDGLIQNGVIKLTDYSTGTTIVQPGQINASSTTSGDSTEVRIAPSGDGYSA